ncbi:MAG: tetratricopeptide repeat protein [Candidatus Nanopelagicales bacterium]
MTAERERHLERRDQALRDLVELDRQVQAGELSALDERRLREGYEREVAAALTGLDRLAADAAARVANPAPVVEDRGRRGLLSRRSLYASGLAAVLAAGLLLPGNVLDRPQGGFVTGNEALQDPGSAPTAPPPAADLSKVSDAEMEAVVAANPEIIGMRLALADRYTASGRYDLAAVHYRKVLEQDPTNPQGKASLGWLMFRLGEIDQAARLVDEALQAAPELVVGWWYQANIRLYGFNDPAGAIQSLDVMRARPDLSAEVRGQVESLRQQASQGMGR